MDSLELSRAGALPALRDQSSRRPPRRAADRPKPAPVSPDRIEPEPDEPASSQSLDVLA
jgi:hypothetical protein